MSIITMSLFIFFSTINPSIQSIQHMQSTQHITAVSTQAESNSIITESLTLSTIDPKGYYFVNKENNTGAFVPSSEATKYHVNNLKQNDTVTMSFNQKGDIITVNNKEVK